MTGVVTLIPATKKVLAALLEGRHFSIGVDLGCGIGSAGPVLRPHFGWLIGVDHNAERVEVTQQRGQYDEVVLADLQEYQWPYGTEAIFLMDVIEHLDYNDGVRILERLSSVPFVVISTPSKFHEFTTTNMHKSLWDEGVFRQYGFYTTTYRTGILTERLEGRKILAVKGI